MSLPGVEILVVAKHKDGRELAFVLKDRHLSEEGKITVYQLQCGLIGGFDATTRFDEVNAG